MMIGARDAWLMATYGKWIVILRLNESRSFGVAAWV